ncbi:helix-turn-helix transcriptional regulator [Micromonospora sp. MP36]|nr:helix-turn-helix transcriptional regulator [Micromonospora sp. MP36]
MSPDQRRAMIVRAALPLLATHGAAVTTAQVARAAGIGEATVFRAFPDKDALLDACVAEALHPGAALADLAAIPLTQPLGDRLTAAATALRAHLDRIGAVLAAAHAAGRPGRGQRDVPPVRDRASGREESVDAVRAAVAALFAPEGDRLRLPADQLAVLFLAVLVPSRTPLAGAAPTPAELVDLFLHGALAPAGPEENR